MDQHLRSKLREGFKLSEKEILECEGSLLINAGDLESRVKLLGCYWFSKSWESAAPHLIWMIDNHPESEVLSWEVAVIGDHTDDQELFKSIKNRWEKQLGKRDNSAQILANAAAFFLVSHSTRSIELLEKALKMDPDNKEFIQKLGRTYQIEVGDQKDHKLLARAIDVQEKAVENDPENPSELAALARFYQLSDRKDEAKQYSDRAVELAKNQKNKDKLAEAHSIRGLIYLDEGLTQKAKEELCSQGPSLYFELANKLIERGEFEPVILYLEESMKHWRAGKLQFFFWITMLKMGMKPKLYKTWLLTNSTGGFSPKDV